MQVVLGPAAAASFTAETGGSSQVSLLKCQF
jgi:hypothetical protein